MKKYTNQQISDLIDEHIHSARNRKILKYRFIDGYTLRKIAEFEDIDLSEKQVGTIIRDNLIELEQYL